MSGERQAVLRVEGLTKGYASPRKSLWSKPSVTQVVKGVSLDIFPGETLGLVGESGCGKTTLAKLIMHLEKPDAGSVWIEGCSLSSLDSESLRKFRKNFQMVFQDPYSSLNPRMQVKDLLAEPYVIHNMYASQRQAKVAELASKVGLRLSDLEKYPHQFSGGQRQRIGIARSLALSPKLLVCDEPVSALDVSVQAQILNLLLDLQQTLGVAYLFISHDLSVISHVSDRIAVMYRGKIVEYGPKEDVIARPLHPYTNVLLASIPQIGRKHPRPIRLNTVADMSESGCAFASRCPNVREKCTVTAPQPTESRTGHAHWATCHYVC